MKIRRLSLLLVAFLLAVLLFNCCGAEEGGEISTFRPVDCGVPAQEVYEYPFIGLTLKTPASLVEKMDAREVFAFQLEGYLDEKTVAYAVMRFSAPTEAQRNEEVESFDILGWEEALDKVGAIGVYRQELTEQLDELTGCDVHEKLGQSEDGAYEYYLSLQSAADQTLADELRTVDATIGEMHELDFNFGYTAFATDRLDDVATVGEFSTTDVFGNACTQEMFAEYDLTLVNAFATWCSPCIREIPELEKLRQAYAEKGVRLGVVGIVLDAKTANGVDEAAVELAKTLHERSGAQYPFLIPDETDMNGRLIGIMSVPESFFVDSQGRIVSAPILGANTMEGWQGIVDEELAKRDAE